MYTYLYRSCWRKCRVSRRFLKVTILAMFLFWCIIWITICWANSKVNLMGNLTRFLRIKSEPVYLVDSTKCQINNLDAFNNIAMKFYHPENYEPCTDQPLLTYVTNIDNTVTLHVDNEAVISYSGRGVVCCYSNVTRKRSEEPDNAITMSECKMFGSSISLHHDTIYVRCFGKEDVNIVYENVHSTFLVNEDIRYKITKPHPKKQISVLLIGIDSVSRLNFIRALPNTHKYVERNGWLSLKGYNKIDDNTLPNLMTILTGRNSTDIEEICKSTELGTFDDCSMLWDDYEELGYITSYAEDECQMSTFNYKKKGFTFPPTDFYFRPYMLASETLRTKKRQGMTYCSGPETSGERIMKLATDFGISFKDHPHFGVFWMNTFSHNQLNIVSGMDDKIKNFLETLDKENVLEHSVVIFFSDHGIRFGEIRFTETGWFEERLPFIYVSFPPWFKEMFPTEYNNFKTNSARLTSPYDLHMTLQHFLVLSGDQYTFTQSLSCPTCKSLLEEIEEDRSCEEAGIEQHWCTCSGYTHIDLDKDMQEKVTTYVLNEIYKIIASHQEGWMCARYFVNNVIISSVSKKYFYTNDTYLLLTFETVPEAVFEATIRYKGDISDFNFSISGTVSRLDRYFLDSDCVTNADLKKYCYCLR